MGSKKKSLFDDIFRLQNSAPEEEDIDPEDADNGFKALLVDKADETEEVGPSSLRRKSEVIADDPRYKGKKASRKDLYSDDEGDLDASVGDTLESGDDLEEDGVDSEVSQSEDDGDDDTSDEGEDDESDDESGQVDTQKDDATLMKPETSDDREKGKSVTAQLAVWDQLMKTRISLQRLSSLCNQLPVPHTWHSFDANAEFHREAQNAHGSVRSVVTALLVAQGCLAGEEASKKKPSDAESDEEIASDEDGGEAGGKVVSLDALDNDDPIEEEEEDDNEEDDEDAESKVEAGGAVQSTASSRKHRSKRKLDDKEMEEVLLKRHKGFQSYRNDTLTKWDEKTRLTHGKIKSKNFAAFELSVLKQIEQVLVNRDRLVRRIHQQRQDYRVLGSQQADGESADARDVAPADDDDDVDMLAMKRRRKQELPVNHELIDDNDFYHVCLRDLIEMKSNEETDPITANRQWLEIQRMRNKQKRKVDTRASKGRKIRYEVKEKLKNYMTSYDKSLWTDEQKDDLYKALFGGQMMAGDRQAGRDRQDTELPTINIGL